MSARQAYVVVIVNNATSEEERLQHWAEVWYRPFSGWRVASTRRMGTKAWATRDAKRLFPELEILP